MFCLRGKIFILFMLLPLYCNAAAIKSKIKAKPQLLTIQADYLLLDEKNGVSKYKGNVLFSKGTLHIKADVITLFFDGQKLIKAFIEGTPADVQHQPDKEAKVHSQAKTMEYLLENDLLILKGQAFVDQGSRHFSGETIEYDARQQTITAAGNKETLNNTNKTSHKGRVHVIIGPNDVSKNANEKINTTPPESQP